MIVSEDDFSVVFACGHGDAVVEEMSRGVHRGSGVGNKEVVSDQSLGIVVTLTLRVLFRGEAVGEFGGSGKVELIFYTVDTGVILVPPD